MIYLYLHKGIIKGIKKQEKKTKFPILKQRKNMQPDHGCSEMINHVSSAFL